MLPAPLPPLLNHVFPAIPNVVLTITVKWFTNGMMVVVIVGKIVVISVTAPVIHHLHQVIAGMGSVIQVQARTVGVGLIAHLTVVLAVIIAGMGFAIQPKERIVGKSPIVRLIVVVVLHHLPLVLHTQNVNLLGMVIIFAVLLPQKVIMSVIMNTGGIVMQMVLLATRGLTLIP